MNRLLQSEQLFQLTRDNRNKNMAKRIIFNNILLAKQDTKLAVTVRKLHNKYNNKLNLKPFDYYYTMTEENINLIKGE